jgi:aminoglycoside 6'-N-acetyltransferase I
MEHHVRRAVVDDVPEWARMRRVLWPQETEPGDHEREIRAYFEDAGAGVTLVAARPSGGLAGFIEVGLRSVAEGCGSSPVPYIEGWYVDPDVRRQGLGGALVRAAEAWAREAGFVEMASDVEPGNATSLRAHRALGYEEVGRTVCFRRSLLGRAPSP